MARNDDRAKARRAKQRGENPSDGDAAAEPTGAASEGTPASDESSSQVSNAERVENEARQGLGGTVGAPAGVDLTEEEYDDESAFSPDAGGAVVGGEVSTTKGPRVIRFFRASWAELQRVIWPNRQQVAQGTAVTLGFVVIAGVYLGAADVAARAIVNLII